MSVPRLELVLEQSLPQLCQQLRDDAPGLNSLNLRVRFSLVAPRCMVLIRSRP